MNGVRDEVEACFTDRPGLHMDEPGHRELPRDPTQHAAGIAALQVIKSARGRLRKSGTGISLRVTKRLPLSGGQGGSAASAVAAATAVNSLIGSPMDTRELLRAALAAEALVAGRHLDNVAPALMGGIVLVRQCDPPEVIALPVPKRLRIALVLPDQRLRTADARAVLPSEVPRQAAMVQAANVATIVWALEHDDLELLGRAIEDVIAEPARAVLLPGFLDAKRAALSAGALGCSISGAGPTSFALAADDETAQQVVDAMGAAYVDCGVKATGRVACVDERGAVVEVS